MAFSRSLVSAYADMPMIGMFRGSRVLLEGPNGFPAIHDWHFEVDQNYVRVLGHGQLAALLAVLSRENLEIATPLKARLQHVEVIVIVFDV
jgi:hypothetical protein